MSAELNDLMPKPLEGHHWVVSRNSTFGDSLVVSMVEDKGGKVVQSSLTGAYPSVQEVADMASALLVVHERTQGLDGMVGEYR